MITATLYSRRDSATCEAARADLESLQGEVPHRLAEIFVEDDRGLYGEYLNKVPIVEVGPYRLQAPFSRTDLLVTLRAANDRRESLERAGDPSYQERVRRGKTVSGGDRLTRWFSSAYVWVIAGLLLLYVGVPFLAPALMKIGMQRAAGVIYAVYSPLCHQLAFRSFFLFGDQFYYPREAAHIAGVTTYGEATGLDEEDLLAARRYRGDEAVGYKVAFCERDVAIYAGMFLFVMIFGATGKRMQPLPFIWWALIGILPVALDGFSQLFSQGAIPALAEWLPYRESTPFLRVATGFLFGFTTAWFGIPHIEDSMRETRRVLGRKYAVVATANAAQGPQEGKRDQSNQSGQDSGG
jgi:uncharacterized membrane protein